MHADTRNYRPRQQRLPRLAADEVERRLAEAESYFFDVCLADRTALTDELTAAVRNAIDGALEAADGDALAGRAADAAWSSLESSLDSLRASAIKGAVRSSLEAAMINRLDEAGRYLTLVRAARAAYESALPTEWARLVNARLDGCEGWVTLADEDWERLRAIILPEYDRGSFRRPVGSVLGMWGRLCAEVLPEAYADPEGVDAPTDVLGGWPAKVDVMAARHDAGKRLYAPGDLELADDLGVGAASSQSDGNGKKDARTIDGEPVRKDLVPLRWVESREDWTPESEWGDDWWRMRRPTGSAAEAVDEVVTAAATEGRAAAPTITDGKRKSRRERAEENWLPFLEG